MTQSLQRSETQHGGRTGEAAWVPQADIVETESAYVVELELPGVWHEDIDLSLKGNELVVTGEVKERKREGLFRRHTRKIGEFEFRATLPGHLREDEVEASLAFGVLRVYVPKADGVTARKIPIHELSDGSA